jgi:hypothetical protein
MPQSIDHIVIAVRDLAEASADYAAAGFTVTPGGKHTGGATHNALVSFADGAYLELIALTDPSQPNRHRWFESLDKGDGAIAFALLAQGLGQVRERVTGAGLSADGPNALGRLRPDGKQVDWSMLFLSSNPAEPLPFLIEDLTPRVLRVPDGAATEHPLGNVTVAGLTIAVGDLAATSPAFTALLGAGADRPASEIAGASAVKRFQVGSHWIELAQPADGESEIGRFLSERGDNIYRIVLANTSGGGKPLPANLTHGVQIIAGS